MYRLFLDDERQPQKAITLVDYNKELYEDNSNWEVVRDYDEFVNLINERGLPSMVSFDHDLADIKCEGGKMSWSYKEKTGYDCAKWLVDYCITNDKQLPKYQVHSANPVGRENIEAYLGNAKKHVGV